MIKIDIIENRYLTLDSLHRILIVIKRDKIDYRFRDTSKYNLVEKPNRDIILRIKHKGLRLQLLNALSLNVPIVLLVINDETDLISFLNDYYYEVDNNPPFTYIPIVDNDINESKLIEFATYLYINGNGGIVYRLNDDQVVPYRKSRYNIVDLPNIRSTLISDYYYYNLDLCIQLAKARLDAGYTIPYHDAIQGYTYKIFRNPYHIGYYDYDFINSVLEYEHVKVSISNILYITKLILTAYKHKFEHYTNQIVQNLSLSYRLLDDELFDDLDIEIVESDDNNLILFVRLVYKKPKFYLQFNIIYPYNVIENYIEGEDQDDDQSPNHARNILFILDFFDHDGYIYTYKNKPKRNNILHILDFFDHEIL